MWKVEIKKDGVLKYGYDKFETQEEAIDWVNEPSQPWENDPSFEIIYTNLGEPE